MKRYNVLILVSALCFLSFACGAEDVPSIDREIERQIEGELQLDVLGISEPFDFVIPEQTRSITIIAEGADNELLGIASLVVGDGQDLVSIDLDSSLAEAMNENYFDLQSGLMPGNLYQSIRLGTFTHVYPYAPGLDVIPGNATLRFASTSSSGSIKVRILMPKDDGGNILHLNIVRVASANQQEYSTDFVAELGSLLGAADIGIVVDEFVEIVDAERARITDFSEPQETPSSQSASLAVWGRGLVASDAVNVYLVDSLPFGVGGLALGTPGPPDPTSYYYGVLARYSSDSAELARIVAHELAHFLILQHVENRDLVGTTSPDPISDTEPGQDNLMEQGSALTPGQSFALTRSSLLTLE